MISTLEEAIIRDTQFASEDNENSTDNLQQDDECIIASAMCISIWMSVIDRIHQLSSKMALQWVVITNFIKVIYVSKSAEFRWWVHFLRHYWFSVFIIWNLNVILL